MENKDARHVLKYIDKFLRERQLELFPEEFVKSELTEDEKTFLKEIRVRIGNNVSPNYRDAGKLNNILMKLMPEPK
jgi:hypothetical protein